MYNANSVRKYNLVSILALIVREWMYKNVDDEIK